MAALPLRLQVLNRIVEILEAMKGEAGATFWFTAYRVVKRFADSADAGGFPFYMVAPDSGQAPEWAGQQLADELMAVSVKAWVNLEGDEPTTKLEKCLADVRKAVMDDQASGPVGSLATLTLGCNLDSLETDGGVLALDGLGYFDQRFVFRIPVHWGTT